MWIDIFPIGEDVYLPPPVDIIPPKAEEYELRIIIWEVYGIKPKDRNKSNTMDITVRG